MSQRFIRIFVLMILLCHYLCPDDPEQTIREVFLFLKKWVRDSKVKKGDIAAYYGITRPTLSKWVKYIPSKIDFDEYKRKRKLNLLEFWVIQDEYGVIDEQEPLEKGRIKEICETRYNTISENITLSTCGITKEAYQKMDIFPPKVSQQIINHLG